MLFSKLRYLALLTLIILTTFSFSITPSNAANSSAGNDIVLKTKESNEIPVNSGIVLETMDAADYTYIKVQTDEDNVWVAMPTTKVKTGVRVNYALGMVMRDFESKTLGRTFAKVIFSPGLISDNSSTIHVETESKAMGTNSFSEAVKKETQQQVPAHSLPQNSAGSAGATVPLIEDSVSPAPGDNGYTVGQIFAQAQQLDGKTVQVRGKVVKINLNIMGKNWIHIQDGTGDPMKNSHDLVVTSAVAPELNKIVLVEGKVAADRDFGYGYSYDAIIEEAVFKE